MSRLLYQVIWWLGGPLILVGSLLSSTTRKRWAERWAFRLPDVEPGALWVHAASLGEGRAAEALFHAMRTARTSVFLRTASSTAGLEHAKGQEVLSAFPMDAPWVVRRWLDRVRPRALVLIEAELWPNLILGCQRRGIPVLLVSARRGTGQARFSRWAPGLYRKTLEGISWCSCTSSADAEYFRSFGVESEVAADLKLDAPVEASPVVFHRPWWVGASTHAPEEAFLVEAQSRRGSSMTLVLAPRRLERIAEVRGLVEKAGLSCVQLSALRGECDTDVLLVDSFGLLSRFFRGASAAYVGGTMVEAIGGHSPAEAAAAGVPIIAGPHRSAHEEFWGRCVFRETGENLDVGLAWALETGPCSPLKGGAAAILPHVLRAASGPVPKEGMERLFLWPISWVWRALTSLRNASWILRTPRDAGIPVVSVGSLGSGGTGKTVVTLYIAGELQRRGQQVAVVARGYKRQSGPSIRLAEDRSDAAFLGDELAMMSRRGIEVVSGPDRVKSAAVARERGASVVVLDDAFQHRRIARDLDVVVIDGEWPRSGGPMPVGTEREGVQALHRADVIWLHGAALDSGFRARLPADVIQVRGNLHPVGWVNAGELLPLDALEGLRVCAFAGIGRPGRFLAMLVELGVEVVHWRAFPDHHQFNDTEIEELRLASKEGLLVCTEKDFVRLPEGFPALALRVEMRIEEGEEALQTRLAEVVAQ